MKKNNTEQLAIEDPPIVEEEPKNSSPKNTAVNFNFTDDAAHEDDMTPVRDILSAGQEETEDMMMDLPLLTVEEVATFLKGTYDVQGWFTYPDLWKRDPSFFTEVAIGILPQINAWAARVPAVAHAVKTVSAAGSWGRLIWDIAGTWIMVMRRRQLEVEKKLEEEEAKQNGGYSVNYPTQQQQSKQPVTNTTKLGKEPGYIIP